MSFIRKKIAWYWLLPAIIITAAVTVMATYIPMKVYYKTQISEAYRSGGVDNQTYAYVKELFETYYIGEVGEFDEDGATDSLIAAYVASTGDKYARYMNPEAYREYMTSMTGSFVGIGIQVIYDEAAQAMEVILVMPDSPAEKAGISAGDLIVAVDGNTVAEAGYLAVADTIRGEEGTSVSLRLQREEQILELTVVRAPVTSLSVIGSMASDGMTGIIRILQFDDTTPGQFSAAVEQLQNQGSERFVFDLRDNPGGELESVLSVLGYILPKDSLLIRIVDANGEETTRSTADEHVLDCPMAVLINGNTASAAELFTSCLRDYDAAKIIGVTSYGKGCMQRLFQLPNGGAVTITIRMYNPPIGENYEGIGITPDLTVSLSEEAASLNLFKLTEENDDQLKAALQLLKQS